jgi:RNA polymerase sigma-70 factor (ECF subfamily)
MEPTSPTVDRSEREARLDEWLALRCQLGEPGAVDDLVARWHDPLWRYVRRVSGSDEAAADIVQDVWLRVIRGLVRLREPASLRAWLFGIARRALMDRMRDKYASPVMVEADLTAVAAEVDGDPGLDDDHAMLHEELARLPVVDREVLGLFYLKELSLLEIAQILDIPPGTVKSRLFKARRLLRTRLETARSL